MTRVLFDTQAFLWMIQGYEKLSPRAVELIEDPENHWYLSVASVWEITIKSSMGKLRVTQPISRLISEHVLSNSIELLHASAAHFDELAALPMHHRDPFDRLILAQAKAEGMTVLSCDGYFPLYEVDLAW